MQKKSTARRGRSQESGFGSSVETARVRKIVLPVCIETLYMRVRFRGEEVVCWVGTLQM